MTSSSIVPPPGNIVSVYWTITDSYGGMTKVMLRRTTMLAAAWKRKAQLLLLSGNDDMSEVRDRLKAEEVFGRKVKVRNPWEEFRTTPDRKLRSLVGDDIDEPRSIDDTLPYTGEIMAKRTNEAGVVVQTDRFRRNGTVYISHRRDMRTRGVIGGPRITVFGRRGDVIAEWSTATRFYQSWIDYVIGGTPTYLFSDSTFVGPMLADYRRDHVTTVQTLHGPHLRIGAETAFDALRPAMLPLVSRMEGYDVAAVLTRQQAKDMADADIADNVAVVPNAQPHVQAGALLDRDPTRGVLIGRLSEQKQIDHAIKAMSLARNPKTTLDIYGSGELHDELAEEIRESGVDHAVKLRGHDPHAKDHFNTASFSVLSSLYEGQPLVLLESMAAGCIPVAYDIKYGPASMIDDGVDGFLVPPGDTDALAAAIDRVSALSPEQLRTMRAAAMDRVKQFSDRAVTDTWAGALTRARSSKPPIADVACAAALTRVRSDDHGITIDFRVSSAGNRPIDSVRVVWIGRDESAFGRADATLYEDDEYLFSARLNPARLGVAGDKIVDLYVDVRVDGNPARIRLTVGDAELPTIADDVQVYATKFGNVSVRMTDQ